MRQAPESIPIHDFSIDDASSIPFRFIPIEDKEDHDVSVPHRHNYYEILIFDQGPGEHDIDFQTYPINTGSIHFVSPGQVHQVRRTKGSYGQVIYFSRDFFLANTINKQLLFELPFLNNSVGSPVLVLNDHEYTALKPTLDALRTEADINEPFAADLIKTQLHALLLKCHRYYLQKDNIIQPESAFSQIKEFRVLLELNFRRLHKVQDYAEKLHVSAKTLNQLCKKATGKTASEFIYDRIILEAKRLLAHSPMSVKEVAVFLNYDDPAHFSKFFKKHTGESPSAFGGEE